MRGRLREGVTGGQEPRREPDASRRCDCSKRGVVDGNSERQATGSGRDSRGGCDERQLVCIEAEEADDRLRKRQDSERKRDSWLAGSAKEKIPVAEKRRPPHTPTRHSTQHPEPATHTPPAQLSARTQRSHAQSNRESKLDVG